MDEPKFTLSHMFIAVAVVAAWLATIRLGFELGKSVRNVICCYFLAIPICGVICHRGRRQIFWIGCLTMFVLQLAVDLKYLHGIRRLSDSLATLFVQNDYPNGTFSWLDDTFGVVIGFALCLSGAYLCLKYVANVSQESAVKS